MTLQTDLETAVTQVAADAAKLEAIVNGPATGEGSLVSTDGGDVKSVARAIAEIGDVTNQALKDLSNVLDADFATKAAVAGVDGTVTSVATAGLATGGPITGSGTITVNVASQAEAEAGTATDKAMTPQRVAQAIAALAAGEDQVARDMAVVALVEANAAGVAGTKGPLILVDPFTSDTLDTSTNATYDDKYHNPGGYTSDLCSGGTVLSSTANGSYPAAQAVDDNDSTEFATLADPATTADYIGYDLGSDEPITQVTIRQSQESGATGLNDELTIESSDNGSSWSSESVEAVPQNTTKQTLQFTPSGAHRYWRIRPTGAFSSATRWHVAELEMMEDQTPSNMVLAEAGGAGGLDTADPSDLSAYFLFVFPDADVTVGTDVTGELSIDGGTTQATGAWTKIGDYGAGELWRLDADVSAQTGDNPHWEINTLNNKSVELHACGGILPIYTA